MKAMTATTARTATKTAVPEVVVERVLPAAPGRVYRALTEPAELERWLFTEAEGDPKPGGSYRMRWKSSRDSSKDHERSGKYLELVPGRRVVFEWKGDGSGCGGIGGADATVVSIDLEPEGEGTRLRLVHTGWPAGDEGRKARNGHFDGWNYYVENLGRVLGGGKDTREEAFGQVVRVRSGG